MTCAIALVCLTAFAGARPASASQAAPVTIFAAASLAGLIETAAETGAVAPGRLLRLVHASSGQLARQLLAGAPADAFIAADPGWAHEITRSGKIAKGSPATLFAGALVLVAHVTSTAALEPVPGADIGSIIGKGHLAMGDPAHVPAGAYGRQALRWLGQWRALEGRIAFTDNVRQAVALVARGEAPAAIVYLSDAMAEDRVRVIATFPAESHEPILYSGIALAGGDTSAAARLFDYLRSNEAKTLLEERGFLPLGRAAQPPS